LPTFVLIQTTYLLDEWEAQSHCYRQRAHAFWCPPKMDKLAPGNVVYFLLESKQLSNFFYIDRHQNAHARCL